MVLSAAGSYEQISNQNRTWSLNSDTIHNVFNGSHSFHYCNNSMELSQNIAKSVNEYNCNVKWLGTEEICQIMSKYSRIYFLGDSHLRYNLIAFLCL